MAHHTPLARCGWHALLLAWCGMAAAQAQPLASSWGPRGSFAAPTVLEHRTFGPVRPVALSPVQQLRPEPLLIAARRRTLPASAQMECSALDTRLPTLERAAQRAPPEHKADAQQALSQARQRYAALRC